MIVHSRGKVAQVGAVADVLGCPADGEVELLVNRRNLDLPSTVSLYGQQEKPGS
jgi:hypothetical protein